MESSRPGFLLRLTREICFVRKRFRANKRTVVRKRMLILQRRCKKGITCYSTALFEKNYILRMDRWDSGFKATMWKCILGLSEETAVGGRKTLLQILSCPPLLHPATNKYKNCIILSFIISTNQTWVFLVIADARLHQTPEVDSIKFEIHVTNYSLQLGTEKKIHKSSQVDGFTFLGWLFIICSVLSKGISPNRRT